MIGRTMQKHLDRIGAPKFDEKDQEFAKAVQKEVGAEPSGLSTEIVPFGPNHGGTASSDLGEVSAAKPLAELNVVTRPMGTAAHTWGQTACAIHPLGLKGMDVASKVLGATAVDFLQNPKLVSDAKAEFARATKGKPYQSPLAMDAKPAVY